MNLEIGMTEVDRTEDRINKPSTPQTNLAALPIGRNGTVEGDLGILAKERH